MKLPVKTLATWVSVPVGFLTIMFLQLQVLFLWQSVYSRFPTRGYEELFKSGQATPSLAAPSSLIIPVVALVLALVSAATARAVKGRLRSSLSGIWLGAIVGYCAVWLAIPALRKDSDMWPIDLIFISIGLALPIIFGGAIGRGRLDMKKIPAREQ